MTALVQARAIAAMARELLVHMSGTTGCVTSGPVVFRCRGRACGQPYPIASATALPPATVSRLCCQFVFEKTVYGKQRAEPAKATDVEFDTDAWKLIAVRRFEIA